MWFQSFSAQVFFWVHLPHFSALLLFLPGKALMQLSVDSTLFCTFAVSAHKSTMQLSVDSTLYHHKWVENYLWIHNPISNMIQKFLLQSAVFLPFLTGDAWCRKWGNNRKNHPQPSWGIEPLTIHPLQPLTSPLHQLAFLQTIQECSPWYVLTCLHILDLGIFPKIFFFFWRNFSKFLFPKYRLTLS